jgi:hypothetical protein
MRRPVFVIGFCFWFSWGRIACDLKIFSILKFIGRV